MLATSGVSQRMVTRSHFGSMLDRVDGPNRMAFNPGAPAPAVALFGANEAEPDLSQIHTIVTGSAAQLSTTEREKTANPALFRNAIRPWADTNPCPDNRAQASPHRSDGF